MKKVQIYNAIKKKVSTNFKNYILQITLYCSSIIFKHYIYWYIDKQYYKNKYNINTVVKNKTLDTNTVFITAHQ